MATTFAAASARLSSFRRIRKNPVSARQSFGDSRRPRFRRRRRNPAKTEAHREDKKSRSDLFGRNPGNIQCVGSTGEGSPVSNPTVGNVRKITLTSCSSSFAALSTSVGGSGGGGRGRRRGSSFAGPPDYQSSAEKIEPGDDDFEGHPPSPFPSGLGHGGGKPLPSTPLLPSFSSFMSAVNSSGSIGRGRAPGSPPSPLPPQSDPEEHFIPKKPIFFSKEEAMMLGEQHNKNKE
ncbi:hypothetical protein U1Q18_017667 [Sarracenia purpurea var. burkii]